MDASLVKFMRCMESHAERALPGQTRMYYKIQHPSDDVVSLTMTFYGATDLEAFTAYMSAHFYATMQASTTWLVRRPDFPPPGDEIQANG